MEFSNLSGPLALSVLYPRGLTLDASPKAISGRTSYHQVRLAFHRYPQLIQVFCNRPWFGPPRTFKCASPWFRVYCYGLIRPIKTRFRYGSGTSVP